MVLISLAVFARLGVWGCLQVLSFSVSRKKDYSRAPFLQQYANQPLGPPSLEARQWTSPEAWWLIYRGEGGELAGWARGEAGVEGAGLTGARGRGMEGSSGLPETPQGSPGLGSRSIYQRNRRRALKGGGNVDIYSREPAARIKGVKERQETAESGR